MCEVGHTYVLPVVKQVEFGVFLDAGELGTVLLPKRRVPENTEMGDRVKVFIYLDSEDRPIATTQKPLVEVDQFAFLKVAEITPIGAFLEWGLDKHILVPYAEQHKRFELERSYLVFLYLDPRDGRIVASSKIDKFIDESGLHDYEAKQPVDLIIAHTTELGIKAIVDHRYIGVLYQNELIKPLRFGQSVKGFIQQVRSDGKLDLTLHGGRAAWDKNCQTVVNYLARNGGYAPLHDKSSPQEIADYFGMSKAAFKKAIGGLYKKKKIRLEENGIRWLESSSEQE